MIGVPQRKSTMRSTLLLPLVAAIISATSAPALESSVTARSSLPPGELWRKIGDFCGITAWDPAVERCDLSEDGKQRTILFFGGLGRAVTVLDAWDDANRSFRWTTSSAPAPVSNYRATLSVIAEGQTSVLKLSASFDAKGVSDEEAKRIIDAAIFRAFCLSSPLRCTDDLAPITSAEVVEFDGLSLTTSRLTLRGYIRRPDRGGPSPAVVLLHGCGGFPEALDQEWGVKIVAWGYVTLTVDSFGPRNLKNTCGRGASAADTAFDPYQALKFLVKQQFVDPQRVMVVGFSQGGWLSLSAVERGPIEQLAENKFVAAAAFYPICRAIKGPMTVPTLILTGENDGWTPADACRKLAAGEDEIGMSRLKDEGSPIQLIVYPNAYHGFDLSNLRVPVTYFGHRHEYNKEATDQATRVLQEFLRIQSGK
jgi:dienelactone hydrolase